MFSAIPRMLVTRHAVACHDLWRTKNWMIPARHVAELSRKNVIKTGLSESLRPSCGFVNKATQHAAMITIGRTIARLVAALFAITGASCLGDRETSVNPPEA